MKSKVNDYTFAFQSETLQKLSLTHHMVVSTGGGAVIRPINWYDNGNNGSKSLVFSVCMVGFAVHVLVVQTNTASGESGNTWQKELVSG